MVDCILYMRYYLLHIRDDIEQMRLYAIIVSYLIWFDITSSGRFFSPGGVDVMSCTRIDHNRMECDMYVWYV